MLVRRNGEVTEYHGQTPAGKTGDPSNVEICAFTYEGRKVAAAMPSAFASSTTELISLVPPPSPAGRVPTVARRLTAGGIAGDTGGRENGAQQRRDAEDARNCDEVPAEPEGIARAGDRPRGAAPKEAGKRAVLGDAGG